MFCFAPMLFLCTCFTGQKQQGKNDAAGVKFTFTRPLFDSIGQISKTDSVVYYEYYLDTFSVRKYVYRHHYQTADTFFTSAERSFFVIWGPQGNMAYNYDPYRPEKSKQVSKDSAFEYQKMEFDVYMLFRTGVAMQVYSRTTANGGILQEAYIGNTEIDKPDRDTLFLSFSNNLRHINMSLSKELDSIRQMKLYKIILSKQAAYAEQFKKTFAASQLIFELSEEKTHNQQELLDCINKYKKAFEQQ